MNRIGKTERDRYAEPLLGDPEGDPVSPESEEARTRWLARCIVSESDDEYERYLIGWTVRLRTETGYYTDGTYEGTVLKRYQFSAFNPGSPKRSDYVNLPESLSETPYVTTPQWENALLSARRVVSESVEDNPFTGNTPLVRGTRSRRDPRRVRHFFAPSSMVKTDRNSYAEWMGEKIVVPAWFDRSKHVPMGTEDTFFFAEIA